MLCVRMTVGDIIQGEPLTLDLLDRALEHTVEIIVTITGALS